MNIKMTVCPARLLFLGSILLVAGTALPDRSAKADLFCWPGEQNCVQDGRIGTSGNDILGNPGGDTIQKGAALLDRGLGTGGLIQQGVNQIYEPNKRGILDCVGAAVAPGMPSMIQGSIDPSQCGPSSGAGPGGPAALGSPPRPQMAPWPMGGAPVYGSPSGGLPQGVMPGLPAMGGLPGLPGLSGMTGMPGMPGMSGMPAVPGMGGMPSMPQSMY